MSPTHDALPVKLPPQDLAAERAVLGCAILETDGQAAALVAAEPPEIFHKEAHRHVARAIHALVGQAQGVDPITLRAELERMGVFEEVGGQAALAAFDEEASVAFQVPEYLAIVRDHAVRRRMIQLGRGLVEEGFEASAPPTEVLGRHVEACLRLEQGAAPDEILTPAQLVADYAAADEPPAIETGVPLTDTLAGGLRSSNLTLLAGRPGLGKTTLATQILHHVAVVNQIPSLFLSLDMHRREIADRLLALHAGVAVPGGRRHPLRDAGRLPEMLDRFRESAVYLADPTAPTITQVIAMIRRAAVRHGVRLVIVDYVQKIIGRGRDRYAQVSDVAESLRVIARQLAVPILALAQLNREPEKRELPRPRLSDLRESGALEQESAVILFLWTKADVEKLTDPQEMTLTLAKNRFGELSERPYLFLRSLGRFGPLDARRG